MDETKQVLALNLTVAEINVILRSLGKHPFEEIAALIQKIKQQGESQLQQEAPAAPEVSEAVTEAVAT